MGDMEITPDMDAGHVKYMHERPGSHGLFSQEEDIPDMKEIQKELLNHKGLSWRWVLSLEESDAVNLGYTNREAWEKTLRATMKDAAAAMGISESNLRWVAAFHRKKGHPHVHILLWEKEPTRKQGELSEGELRDIKRIFMREIDEVERNRLEAEKTALRDLIRDTAKRSILDLAREEAGALIEEAPGIEPLMTPEARKELAEKLNELAEIMPGHGRIALKYMPPAVKEKAREISAWLLAQPGFLDSTEKYRKLSEELAKYFVKKDEKLEEAADRAFNDIRDRVAQLVLKGAADIQKVENIIEQKPDVQEENEPLPAEDAALPEEEFIEKNYTVDIKHDESEELSPEENTSEKLWRSACYILGKEYIAQNPGADILKPEIGEGLRNEVLGILTDISHKLPQVKGKIKFEYLSPELQQKIMDTAKWLLSREQFKGRFDEITNKGHLVRQIADQVIIRASDLMERDFSDEIEILLDNTLSAKAVEKILEAKADLVRDDPEESKWTVGTIYRTFVYLGKEEKEAWDAAERFGKDAGLAPEEIALVLRKTEEKIDFIKSKNIPLCIGRDNWQRLTENLGFIEEEFQKPWYGKISIEKKAAKDLWRTACFSLGRETGRLPEMESDFKYELSRILEYLSTKIPYISGKIKYEHLPENIREEVKRTAEEIFSQEGLNEIFTGLSPERSEGLIRDLAEKIIYKAKSLSPVEFNGNSTPLADEELVPPITEKLKSADGNLIQKDEAEVLWTARTIYRTFVYLGKKEEDARDAASKFATKAGLSEDIVNPAIEKEKNLMEYMEREGRPKCIYRNDWQRLTENLGLKEEEFPRPWTSAKSAEGRAAENLWRTTCFSLGMELKKERPDFEIIRPQLSDNELKKEIIARLKDLTASMPDQKGRPAYAYLSDELKEQAREISVWLLNREELQGRVNELEDKESLIHRIAENVVSRAYDLMPREIPDGIKMIVHETRKREAIEKMKDANANFIDDEEEMLWTIKTMYRALIYLGKEEEEARETVSKFATKAGLSEDIINPAIEKEKNMLEYMDNTDPGRLRFISRDEWQRLGENLGLKEEEFLRPWFGVREKDENEKEARREFRDELGVKLVEERIAGVLEAFTNSSFHPQNPNELRWTITTMAAALKAMGIGESERANIVRDWCERSGVKITEARLRDVLDRAELSDEDIWLGKRSWSRLMENLGFEEKDAPECPWQVGRPMPLSERIAVGVWKSAWKSLERERSKAEAQSRYASMMTEKKAEIKAKRSRTHDAAIEMEME